MRSTKTLTIQRLPPSFSPQSNYFGLSEKFKSQRDRKKIENFTYDEKNWYSDTCCTWDENVISWEKSSHGEDINSSLVLHPNVHSREEMLRMKASGQVFQIQESLQISSNFTKYI